MSMASLEREIVQKARIALNNPKLRTKDLLEWSTSEAAVKKNQRPEEVTIHLPDPGVWICVAKSCDKLTTHRPK